MSEPTIEVDGMTLPISLVSHAFTVACSEIVLNETPFESEGVLEFFIANGFSDEASAVGFYSLLADWAKSFETYRARAAAAIEARGWTPKHLSLDEHLASLSEDDQDAITRGFAA